MGSNSSALTTEKKEEQRLNNIKKLFNNNDNTDDIIETLNLTEFKQVDVGEKKSIPLIGGGNGNNNNDDDNYDEMNNRINNSINNKRYTKYDLFKILKDIDSEFQKGGANCDTDDN